METGLLSKASVMASKSGAEPQEEVIEVSATLLEKSCGVALDIGGSVAKVVYRCNQLYKGGKLIDNTKAAPGVGYLKLVSFPREAVHAYLQYIVDHADLTGNPPRLNSCGFGAVDNKEAIEKKLKVKLNTLSELRCFGGVLLRIINHAPLSAPFYDLDQEGLQQGQKGFYRVITFQFISDGLPMPGKSQFEGVVSEAMGKVHNMMKEEIKLPCMVVMCGSAFAPMMLRENGSFEVREVTLLAGRSFLGLTSIITGERDWTNIKEMLDTHDGSTAYSYRSGGSDQGNTQEGDKDPYSTTEGMRFFPFGNANVVPRDTINDGDLLYTLFETFSINIATLAYNTALAQDMHQVLFCGGFVNNPLARTIITREILQRNIHAYYGKHFNKLVDFRFIKNGEYLGAFGAMVNTDTE